MLLKKKVNTYTFREFKKLNELETITLLDKSIEYLKTNKKLYLKIVVIIALTLHYSINPIYAQNIENALNSTFKQLINLLMSFAKWGCIAMGLKSAIESMLNGGSFRNATMSGLQYWAGYIFLQLYPKLFEMIKIS